MSNDEIYNTNSNPSSTEDIIELGTYLLAGLFAGKHLQNKIVDHNRREFLDKLPMQNLGWWAEQDLRGFYRNKKFYVTQFPDTHPKVFPHAAKLLFALLKFHGNRRESVMGRWQLQTQVNNFIRSQARVLGKDGPQWQEGNVLKLTHHNPNWNLSKFLNSTEIRDLIFGVKKDKRIDVAIYQAKLFGRMEKSEELKEENWALWNIYEYLIKNEYILHIFDLAGGFTFFKNNCSTSLQQKLIEQLHVEYNKYKEIIKKYKKNPKKSLNILKDLSKTFERISWSRNISKIPDIPESVLQEMGMMNEERSKKYIDIIEGISNISRRMGDSNRVIAFMIYKIEDELGCAYSLNQKEETALNPDLSDLTKFTITEKSFNSRIPFELIKKIFAYHSSAQGRQNDSERKLLYLLFKNTQIKQESKGWVYIHSSPLPFCGLSCRPMLKAFQKEFNNIELSTSRNGWNEGKNYNRNKFNNIIINLKSYDKDNYGR
jgi:hypothetical protein